MTTIASYLKVAELAEGHRVASVMFGKLSRNIRVELLLPLSERTMDGDDFISMCRLEMDRLTEQTPNIPKHIEKKFAVRFQDLLQQNFYPPELLQLHPVDIYRDDKEAAEDRTASVIASAALHFQRAAHAAKQEEVVPPPPPPGEVRQELAHLSQLKAVSSALRKDTGPSLAPFFGTPPSPAVSEDALQEV
jgi:hypothetical protein